ncbi:amidase [Flaviflexus huanghaiensis]|uniref:amidase n=1 Tax=Flaviflexus huanghaiensis TaxID=1111473 RepID=UPI0019D64668|nr:amidase [Flaviflexus huanghaiensis]
MTIHKLSALDLAATIKAGEVSAHDVLDHTLARIAAFPQVGAFAHVTEQLAREQADETDIRVAAGKARPFDGVPLPIKDATPVAGQPWEQGAAIYVGNIAEADDGVVTLLKEAGTLTVGKTSAPEFSFPAYTEPEIGPPARCPWDVTRTAGGSSGGAAAAVVTGMVPAAHASDGGGSIRIPAAACGAVGFKASRGVVSPGPTGVSGSGLTTHGVITRTVEDSAALLDVLAVRWPGESYHPPRDEVLDLAGSYLDASRKSTGLLRVGLLLEPLNVDSVDLHPSAEAAALRLAGTLESLGHSVTTVARPFPPKDWLAFMPLWTGAAAAIPLSTQDEGNVTELTRWLRDEGRKLSAADFAVAMSAVQSLTRKAANGWADVDIVLTPTLSGPPAYPGDMKVPDGRADFDAQMRFTPWASVWNMTGNASITLPVHRAEVDGVELPFGAMLGAVRPGADALLLSLARDIEEADPWPTIREPTGS